MKVEIDPRASLFEAIARAVAAMATLGLPLPSLEWSNGFDTLCNPDPAAHAQADRLADLLQQAGLVRRAPYGSRTPHRLDDPGTGAALHVDAARPGEGGPRIILDGRTAPEDLGDVLADRGKDGNPAWADAARSLERILTTRDLGRVRQRFRTRSGDP